MLNSRLFVFLDRWFYTAAFHTQVRQGRFKTCLGNKTKKSKCRQNVVPLNTVRIARLSCLGKNSVKESGVKYDRELKYQQKKKTTARTKS